MEIPYTLIRSNRKTIAIHITPEGAVEVRCPRRCSRADVEAFVLSKQDWIVRHLERISRQPVLPKLSESEIRFLAEQAAASLPERVRQLAAEMGVSYGRITIRSQKTRWGSCSSKGNLNFNCLLALVPPDVLDYIVVHELCHRKELNHSERFWTEVGKVLPDYKIRKKWLKDNGANLIARL